MSLSVYYIVQKMFPWRQKKGDELVKSSHLSFNFSGIKKKYSNQFLLSPLSLFRLEKHVVYTQADE